MYLCIVVCVINWYKALEEGVQKQQLDKIMDLLEEIKDPFGGQNAPAMIGLEYIGELHTI